VQAQILSAFCRRSWEHHLHKRVLETHHGNDENIHAKRKANNEHVEFNQASILGQAARDQIALHNADKVHIQHCIDKKIDDLFDTIPPFVNQDVAI
jgi:hypothetical protein